MTYECHQGENEKDKHCQEKMEKDLTQTTLQKSKKREVQTMSQKRVLSDNF